MNQMEKENNTFVNFSNHPSDRWDRPQLEAALEYGSLVDMPFPEVNPSSTREEIKDLARTYIDKITQLRPAAVMCQGEFTLCYAVITGLKERNVTVLAACSRRMVEETEKGKIVTFIFERFREY